MNTMNLHAEIPRTELPETEGYGDGRDLEKNIGELERILYTLPHIRPRDDELFQKTLMSLSGISDRDRPADPTGMNDVIRLTGALHRCLRDMIADVDRQIGNELKKAEKLDARVRKLEGRPVNFSKYYQKMAALAESAARRILRGPYNVY